MYKIYYYNNDLIFDEFGNTIGEELRQRVYECNNEDFENILKAIQDSYGEHGEVTHEHVEDEPTKEELTIKTINNLTIENKKKDILIASLAEQINTLNIKLTQLGGSENV